MLFTPRLVALAIAAAGLVAIAPAHAKTCKDPVTAQARSSAQLSDANREKRAREKAIANWSSRARDTYGWQYRFWTKSEEQKVECGGTAKSKPCTLF
jgi:Tfp pilus assembly protein PilV